MGKETEPPKMTSIPINLWAEEDRPREKMVAQGKKTLTDSELIAILLRTGVRGKSAIDLAKELLQKHGGRLTSLARMEAVDLQKEKGLGQAKAVTILAALELGNRMLKESTEEKEDIVRSSESLFRYIAPKLIDLPHEEFWAIYFNQRNKVVHTQRIAVGGLNSTSADLRIIFKAALEYNAVGIAVAHNHPSGSLDPSPTDKNLTQRIAAAGEIMQIKLIDHLIVGTRPSGKPDFYSFTESGLL